MTANDTNMRHKSVFHIINVVMYILAFLNF